MTPTDALFYLLTILVVLYFITFGLKRFGTRIPFIRDLITGLFDFKSHFQRSKEALAILRRNKWLFIVPFIAYLPLTIISLYHRAKIISQYGELPSEYSYKPEWSEIINVIPRYIESSFGNAVETFATCLVNALGLLFPFLICLGLLILMPWVLRRLSRWQRLVPTAKINLLKWGLIASAPIGSIYLIVVILAYTGGLEKLFEAPWRYLLIIPMHLTIIPTLVIPSICFVLLLTILLTRLKGEKITESVIGRNILVYFKPVLIYFAILSIYSFCEMINLICIILSLTTKMSPILSVLQVPHIIIWLVLLPLPFITVIGDLNFKESLKSILRLYKRCIYQVGGFIIAFIILLTVVFFIRYVSSSFYHFYRPFSWTNFVFSQFVHVLVIFISCIAVIGLVRILQETRELWAKPLSDPPQSTSL